jgi:hypothetical protein
MKKLPAFFGWQFFCSLGQCIEYIRATKDYLRNKEFNCTRNVNILCNVFTFALYNCVQKIAEYFQALCFTFW